MGQDPHFWVNFQSCSKCPKMVSKIFTSIYRTQRKYFKSLNMKSSKIGEDRTTIRLSKCHNFFSIENLPNNVYIEKKFRFQTFWKTTWCYPKKQQKQQKQHFSKICNFGDLAYTHIFCCRSRTTPNELAPFFLERGKIHKNWFRVIFGRF